MKARVIRTREKPLGRLSPALLAAGAGLLLLTWVGLLFFLLGVFALRSDRILPGVQVGDVLLGGRPRVDAAVELERIYNLERPIYLSDERQMWSASPDELGLAVDAAASAGNAYRAGREAGWAGVLRHLLQRQTVTLPPVVVFDAQRLQETLTLLDAAGQAEISPYVLSMDSGKWSVRGESVRIAIDMDLTLAYAASHAQEAVQQSYLPIFTTAVVEMRPVPPELAAAVENLNRDLRLRAYDPIRDTTDTRTLSPAMIAAWLDVSVVEDALQVRVRDSAVQAYLTAWEGALGGGKTLTGGPSPAKLVDAWQAGRSAVYIVHYPPTSYTVRPGDTLIALSFRVRIPAWKIMQANPGMNAQNLVAGTTITIPSLNDLLPLPVVPGKRIVIDIPTQRLATYENGKLRSRHIVSTGIDSSPTMPGVFQVYSHELNAYASKWDLSMPHFLGIYEAAPGFTNGIHGLPMLSSGVRLWANVLGKKASYGCIILSLAEAEDLYKWAENGVVVEIRD